MPKPPDPLYWQKLRQKSLEKHPLKRTPLKRSGTKIKKRSDKRAKQEAIYSKMHKKALPEHEYIECEAKLEGCTGRATQWHHPEGRIGERLTDWNNKKLVCANCHHRIETEPEMAIEKGLSKSRLNKQ